MAQTGIWLRVRARRVLAGLVVASIAGGLLVWWLVHPSISACESEVRYGDQRHGLELCLASYSRTGNVSERAWAAEAYMYLGEHDDARALAHLLISGPHYGDAHWILGYEDLVQGYGAATLFHAGIALVAHGLADNDRGLARDAVLISHVAWKSGDFTAALIAADESLRRAERLDDRHMQVSAYLAKADALRQMGDIRGAANTLTFALKSASTPCDRAWVRLKTGICRMEAGQDGLAMLEFAAATKANLGCGARDVSRAVAFNEAWLRRWKDPIGASARLDELTVVGEEDTETLLFRGYLAADRGAFAEADRYLAHAASTEPSDADWPWEVERARAELSELHRGLFGEVLAEYYYRRAISMVAALRTTARARSAYLVARHRGPFDGLIALLARHGRWRDVLAVMLELDASDMLRATADELVVRAHASFDVDTPTPKPTDIDPSSVDRLIAAWRPYDIVIVIAPSPRQIAPGRERAYRLRIKHGEVTGEDVADANAARKWAGDLFADPSDKAAAQALGEMIVPRDESSRALHVLAIGTLGKVPLAALRDRDGALTVGRRPLVRVLGLRSGGAESPGSGPPVVIADARGDLANAALEGAIVAKALGAGTQLSGSSTPFAATRARLWAAHNAELLHVAGHVGELGRWRALHLADGDVDPAEIVQRRLAPRIAVLAGCGSAAAFDEEGWGSIAAALLESGTAVVLATDRSVGDGAALEVMREFYAQPDWRAAPAQALARVQQGLDARSATSNEEATKARSWAAFSVLGRPPVVAAELPSTDEPVIGDPGIGGAPR